MEFIKILALIVINYLIFINGDNVNGPNYPTNYVAPGSGQLNLPVSQQSVGVNTILNGVVTSQNINQLLTGVNSYGTHGLTAGLNGLSGTNGIITGINNVGANGLGVNGLTGLTDIQTSEIIRRQIQTNVLNGGGVVGVNPFGTTVIGANGLPISTAAGLNGLTAVNAVIDPTTGVTVGYVGANGIVTPVTAGMNALQTGGAINNGYEVVTGLNGVNTVVDRITGATVGYVGANGVVTPINTGINSAQTGYGSGMYPSGRYQVINGIGGVNTVVDQVTGATVGYVGANGAVTPTGGLQNGYGNVYPLGANNGYQVVTGLNGVNTVVDRTTGITVGYLGTNGIVTPISNGLQTGYGSNLYNGYQGINGYGGINPFQNEMYPSTGFNGQGMIPNSNVLINTGLNQYNAYQTGYGNFYPSTMGTGLNGYNPYNTGITNGMNPYYGQQQQFGGYNNGYYPFNAQQQYGGYPMNGNSNSNSQASASSRNY